MFAQGLPLYAKEVLVSLLPIIAVFLIFQMMTRRYQKRQIKRIAVGFAYTYIGLVLSRFVPDIFIGIAFDSGGVASGPMTSTFLLPLSIGVCEALGGNLMTDAFGVVALVALTPLIAIQLMGLVYKLKTEKRTSTGTAEIADDCDAIVDLEEGE